MRIVIGVTGATGVQMAYRLLGAFRTFPEVETHLVVSKGAKTVLELESAIDIAQMQELADYVHDESNMGAVIASGSYMVDGMIVIPCSMKTLSAIANGYADNLIVRSADVCLKEHRRVVLVPREMPLGLIHCKNLLAAAEAGCVIVPPMLTFYNDCPTVEEQVDHIVGKILMQFGLSYRRFKPWKGNEE